MANSRGIYDDDVVVFVHMIILVMYYQIALLHAFMILILNIDKRFT